MNTKPLTFAIGLLAAGYVALALPGCSSDEDDGGNAAGTGGTGGSGTGGKGGSGTGGSGGGTGGTSGTGGSGGAPTTITCGTETCQGASGGLPLQPCCAGAAQDKCGVNIPVGGLGCQEREQAGNPDQSCTDAFEAAIDGGIPDGGFDAGGFDAGGFQVEGCCRPEGVCGIVIDFGGLNLGCVDVSNFGDGGVTVPTCTP